MSTTLGSFPSVELLNAVFVLLLGTVLVLVQRLRRAALARTREYETLLQTFRQQAIQLASRAARAEGASPATSPFVGALTRRLGAIDALAYSIAGDLRRAAQESEPERLRAALARALRWADQLAGLASRGRARDCQTSLAAVWPRVPALLGQQLGSVSLGARFAPDLPPVSGAGELWVQMLAGLVENAVEASGEGSLIEVGAAPVTATAGDVRVWVEDRGRGIPASVLPHVMEPLHSSRAQEGTAGLGLAMIAAIVEAMGGTVTIASRPGEGTRVEIIVPQAGPVSTPVESIRLGGTVLLADDDRLVRQATCRILQRLGLEVVEADSGWSARTALATNPGRFRAAILDVVMPGIPVGEVVALARRSCPDLPVLLVSGYDTATLMEPVLALGGVRFLSKPFEIPTLAQTLDDLFAVRAAT